MGNMCNSQYRSQSGHRKVKRVISLQTDSSLPQTTFTHQKINLQTQKNKVAYFEILQQLTDYQIISQLGKGGQADVYEIQFGDSFAKKTKIAIDQDGTYALRRIYKSGNMVKRQSFQLSKKILMKRDSPFLAKGLLFCEDDQFHYQVMPNYKGGDLASFINNNSQKSIAFRELGQKGIQFAIAGVILALQNLHLNNIIYCDLKLQNILIGGDGYPVLSDFQLAYLGRCMPTKGYCGTRTYIAPQIFLDPYVCKTVDIWALGVALYTLTYGETPYSMDEIKDVRYIMKCQNNEYKYKKPNVKVSKELNDLINSLLRFKSSHRLGSCTFGQIKGHSFFKGFDWEAYKKKNLFSPLKPIVENYYKQRQILVQRAKQIALDRQNANNKRKNSADRQTTCDQFVARIQDI